MIRVALLCDQIRLQSDVVSLLRQESFMVLGCLDKRDGMLEKLRHWAPDAVVLTQSFTGMDAGALIQQIDSYFPDVALLVIGKEMAPEQIRHLFRTGADDVLALPRNLGALPNAIREAHRGRSSVGARSSGSGTLVAVWSPKGGVGCSLVAANLAVAFQTRQRRRTLLVDLNSPFGGVESLLGLRPERDLSDLFRVMDELGPLHLSQAITHHVSGLSVLCASRLIQPLGGLQPDYIHSLARVCRATFDLTILDLPSAWVPPVEEALQLADRTLLVVTPDAPAVRAVQAGVSLLPGDSRDRLMVGVVVNRVSGHADLQVKEIEQMVGLPVVATIHSDFTFLEPLVNTGQALIQPQQRREGRIAQELLQLAQRLA